MRWTAIRLILGREIRDQLRDRRTLFMIFVLPLLLYPLLGMSFFQVAQFVREHPTRVLLVGAEQLPTDPALIAGAGFDPTLFEDARHGALLHVEVVAGKEAQAIAGQSEAAMRQMLDGRAIEVVVVFPDDFAERLDKYRAALRVYRARVAEGEDHVPPEVPGPALYHNSAMEKSQIAYLRVLDVLGRWQERIGEQILSDAGLPATAPRPFEVRKFDVAVASRRDAAVWSKVFPFLLLIWSLTGAFYPAVDLCAGEKERGTLETLLSSPAERSEIVCGKLLTVMLFSIATVVLNLVSMAVTGVFIMSQLPQLGPPPASALLWLLPALLPVSALFSALCLALAAFARSTKEGQYYLMPLLLVTMPLVVLPMAPGVELTLGMSLIPVTGIVLLLRSLLEGQFWQALPYVAPVSAVTLACCWLAVRWAVDQFNSEAVLFRESERVGLSAWWRHIMRDRGATPSVAEAFFCGMLILTLRFFMSFALPQPVTFADFAVLALVSSLVVVATPALLMSVLFTTSPRQSLALRWPRWTSIPAAAALAVVMHPVVMGLQRVVLELYPVNESALAEVERLLSGPVNPWLLLLVMAVMPALCEELAFRGFLLSGFRHLGRKWRAIVLSSLFFGLSHAIFQQSLVAFFVGLVIGFVAVQTASLFPAIVYHVCHNALAVMLPRIDAAQVEKIGWVRWLLLDADGHFSYHWLLIAASGAAAAGLLIWFRRLPYPKTDEESLQERIRHHHAEAVAG